MKLESPYYPIIYVRGYAATMGEIEETVATPYMGFNLGSTKIRQDYEGDVVPFYFESPLIRLMKDDQYVDAYENGNYIPESKTVPPRSIWIFRYYEPVSEDLGDGKRREVSLFAAELRKFILRIRGQICGDDADKLAAFKVHLVAHSMGGLVCRCYLQNICQHGVADAYDDDNQVAQENDKLELNNLPAETLVDKVFTYATPHNGIDMRGINVPDLGGLDPIHVKNFNRGYMQEYLRLPKNSERVDSLNNAFPTDRFFSFIGSNYRDYSAFFGISKKGTGAMSDGLVMMKNASVAGSPRAVAHRSHSGHYGIVNSEEGYQNLRRFLFGDVRVDFKLYIDEITLPKAVEDEIDGDRQRVQAAYNIETRASLRQLKVFLNERSVSQESAIRKTYEELTHDNKPVYLFSGFLLRKAKAKKAPDSKRKQDTALAFTIELGVQVPDYEIDKKFWFDEHFEGGYLFKDTATFHVRENTDQTSVQYGLVSEKGPGVATKKLMPTEFDDGSLSFELPIGFKKDARNPPKPGLRGRLQILARPWR